MDLSLTEEQERFSQEVIDFCKTEPRGEIASPGYSPSSHHSGHFAFYRR